MKLADAIAKRERDYAAALDAVQDADDGDAEDGSCNLTEARLALREAVALVRCLRRLLDGRTVHEIYRAFGAPGDFGYETAIGDALFKTYRGEP